MHIHTQTEYFPIVFPLSLDIHNLPSTQRSYVASIPLWLSLTLGTPCCVAVAADGSGATRRSSSSNSCSIRPGNSSLGREAIRDLPPCTAGPPSSILR